MHTGILLIYCVLALLSPLDEFGTREKKGEKILWIRFVCKITYKSNSRNFSHFYPDTKLNLCVNYCW